MKCSRLHIPDSAIAVLVLACMSCGQSRKLSELSDSGLSAVLSLPAEKTMHDVDTLQPGHSGDTLRVTGLDGQELLIMRAIRDDETGEMVATEELRAAVVSARFRNVAERRGRIELEFQVTVPAGMQDSRWQIRLHPDLFALGDSIRLDDVVVTGNGFRKMQLRGYEQYGRYESRIVTDSSRFIDKRSLVIFLDRNNSLNHISPYAAQEHYTNHLAREINEYRRSRLGDMWDKYVKVPFVTEGVRLDTMLVKTNGDFEYTYVQTVNTRPGLRKIDIKMCGEISDGDRKIYTVPTSDALTFYVSSLNAFADASDRYRTLVISRDVSANTTAIIDFEKGSSVLDESLGDNSREIARVRETLKNLLCSDAFVMDSIVISAFASPEGTKAANDALAYRRARSSSAYFQSYVSRIRDSIRREEGHFISFRDGVEEEVTNPEKKDRKITFISRSGGENWIRLAELVDMDNVLLPEDKVRYAEIASIPDPDVRENVLAKEKFYPGVRDRLYPSLRSVRFDFHLYRAGMVKDTVHTNVLDSTYMEGVNALVNHEYELALDRLAAYQDYNTAVALVALDRNLSALSILESCPKTARVNYLLALIHSRLGDERTATEYYIRSCGQEPSFRNRGNLDPEISALIRKYNLNSMEDL